MRFAVQDRRLGCMGAEGDEPAACGAALPALCSRRCAAQHAEKRGTVFSHFLKRILVLEKNVCGSLAFLAVSRDRCARTD